MLFFILNTASFFPVFKPVPLYEHIRECIKTLIFFNKGSHPQFPDLGTTLYTLFYQPLITEAHPLFIESVHHCLQNFEPRIKNLHITFKKDLLKADLFLLHLTYQIIELEQDDFLTLFFSTRDFYAYF